ncbi:hypothetical protein VDGL01_02935 [Verticillium dahliae]
MTLYQRRVDGRTDRHASLSIESVGGAPHKYKAHDWLWKSQQHEDESDGVETNPVPIEEIYLPLASLSHLGCTGNNLPDANAGAGAGAGASIGTDRQMQLHATFVAPPTMGNPVPLASSSTVTTRLTSILNPAKVVASILRFPSPSPALSLALAIPPTEPLKGYTTQASSQSGKSGRQADIFGMTTWTECVMMTS